MFDDADRPVTIPVWALWRYGLGAQVSMSEDLTLGAAYELSYAGDLPVDEDRGPLAGRIAGEYEDAVLHYFALSMQWKFGREA
jgi:long-chain fatty acid transport protein